MSQSDPNKPVTDKITAVPALKVSAPAAPGDIIQWPTEVPSGELIQLTMDIVMKKDVETEYAARVLTTFILFGTGVYFRTKREMPQAPAASTRLTEHEVVEALKEGVAKTKAGVNADPKGWEWVLPLLPYLFDLLTKFLKR